MIKMLNSCVYLNEVYAPTIMADLGFSLILTLMTYTDLRTTLPAKVDGAYTINEKSHTSTSQK